ncbi:Exoenzyme S synthesis regulatory protein ExsA [Phytobacter ursingii]|uniref:AraC family transcriptional regulator n=1 Tax=Phytobacter ursingii TaxID=1972431 RepID=A0AB35RWW6_9ENTR|nr:MULTISPECIES: AraC family transcriptional regulator [Enterobacteriaceae]MDV2863409.1 AraC family transcriptional regulator [Phytobacter ursingii]VTP13714.1 Exoenzyme S synthesis regulatory protein ExsA [Phytobacter ursingii]
MDNLSSLLAVLAPQCVVNLHCRFNGRWAADHQQRPGGIVPWHVIMRGEARLHIAGKTLNVCAGDILLLPHGSPHLLESLVEWGQVVPAQGHHNGILTQVRTEGPGPSVEVLCGEFHFGPDCHWLFAEEQALIHLQTAERKSFPELETLLTMLVRESQNSLPGSLAMVKGLANTLLAMMLRILLSLRQPPPGMLRLMSDKRLSPALLAVFAEPAYPWTLESMAERCFLSRATFARHFAHSYHQTPQSWLTQLRMALASRLLIDERAQAVDAIAERCGFLSLSSFTKAFKKRYGITPAAYRKESQKPGARDS